MRERIGGQSCGSVYEIDTGEWLATRWPTCYLKQQGPDGFWCVSLRYHSASRHATEAEALVAYEGQQTSGPDHEALKKEAWSRNREMARKLVDARPEMWLHNGPGGPFGVFYQLPRPGHPTPKDVATT